MNRTRKQESSISTQSRINIVSLAKLDAYWTGTEYRIKSMSQLVSWSIELLVEILNANNMMESKINTVAEANRYLEERELHQPSLRARNFQKIGTAIRFDSLRDEGVDPESHVPGQFNVVHNKRSVAPFSGSVSGGDRGDMIQKATEIYKELEAKDEKKTEERYEEEMERGREEQNNFVPSEGSSENKCVRLTEELVEAVKGGDRPTAEESPGEFRLRKKTSEEMDEKEEEIRKKDKAALKLMNRPMGEILGEKGSSFNN